jgi:hypothetical protein
VILEDGVRMEEISPLIKEVVSKEFDRLDEFCMDLATGKINVC